MARWRDDDEDEAQAPGVLCWLCERPMGSITEWHHPVPKAKGGRTREPVHPICHQAIHANFKNNELGRMGDDVERIRALPPMAQFLSWVAGKDPDFHAPTKGKQR